MNVEIGAEASLFPEKEYINGIFAAVYCPDDSRCSSDLCGVDMSSENQDLVV
jgi:hypothetical protein